jgi:glycine cleavage system H protein
MSQVPAECRYTKSHEWVKVEGDTARVGITDHAQEELGDIVYVELPSVGRVVTKEDPFGTVESVKAVSEIYAPVSGEVIEVNDALTTGSEAALNESPYENGWLVKIKLKDPAETDALLDAAAYKAAIGE